MSLTVCDTAQYPTAAHSLPSEQAYLSCICDMDAQCSCESSHGRCRASGKIAICNEWSTDEVLSLIATAG